MKTTFMRSTTPISKPMKLLMMMEMKSLMKSLVLHMYNGANDDIDELNAWRDGIAQVMWNSYVEECFRRGIL